MSAQKILNELKKHQGKGTKHSGKDSYINSGHEYYDVSVPIRRQIVKNWLKNNREISQKDFVAFIDNLYKGKSHEEKSIASILLGYSPTYRERLKIEQIDKWLDHLVGWAEVDSLCQNIFAYKELLKNWKAWSAFIKKLSIDKNINKRRASLVFLTGPVTYSNDERLKTLSFNIIDKLKNEKPILITKAISWLLRSMVRHHGKEVYEYVNKNMNSLPKIAIRETLRKIKTGRK